MDLIHVAYKVRELRQKQKLTIDQLAARSGLSRGYISRLENFRTGASLRALNLIAIALGVEMIDLFKQENAAPEFIFGELHEGELIERNHSERAGMRYFALAFQKTDRKMNPFLVEYSHPEQPRKLDQHDSQEFFVLLEGEIDFFIGTEERPRRMKKDETVYLSAHIPHVARLAEGCTHASALIIYN